VLVTVPSGFAGVLWKRFGGGTVLDPRQLKDEGMRFILPWNKLFLYDLRLQSATETYNAISRDGISLSASINIRYRLKRESIPQLHQSIGPGYVQALVSPEIGNRMLGEKMMERPESEGGDPYRIPLYAMLNLIDTLILGIELPPAVVSAINRKIEQYYISEEYKFRVAREIRESERKKVEAEGIHEFQQIVSQGISDSYLQWRGIEATLQLAQSSNSKIVVIGTGRDGLPVILGNAEATPPQSAPTGDPDTAPKERPVATSPAASSGKAPAEGLLRPSENPPSNQGAASQHFSYPQSLSLSDIEAILSRIAGAARPPAPDTPLPNGGSSKPAQQPGMTNGAATSTPP
jgi:hypothetical protein